ncbi:MAG: hypothetical protein C4338_04275, partial [Rhodanobacteraceae bacterium]
MNIRDKHPPHPGAPLEREGADSAALAQAVDLGGYTLVENASLRARNTLRVNARAALLAEARDIAVLPALLDWPAARNMHTLVLGEGSNVLFAGDFDGLIVTLKTLGIEIVGEDERSARIRVAAGEHWNDV